MIIKIRIKTPKGKAKSTDEYIRFWILPFKVKPIATYNKEDSIINWVVDVDSRKAERIYKNVGRFDGMISTILSSRAFKKRGAKAVGEEGMKEIEDMLKNHTSCEIVRE